MSKLKKRLQVKRKQVRRVVKHRPNTGNGKTPEQQAKENEMIKIMLSRPQPQIVGQTQQNDKLQQQLETANKMYASLMKEAESKRNSLKEMNEMIETGKREVKQIVEDTKHQKKMNKQKEKNIQAKEDAEKRNEEEKEKGEKLDKEQRKYDKRTQEGKHHADMLAVSDKIAETKRNIENMNKEIDEKTMYHDFKKLQDELNRLLCEEASLKTVINSKEFKEPNKPYIYAYTQSLLAQERIDMNRAVIQKLKENKMLENQKKGLEEFYNDINSGSPIQKKDEAGNLMFNGDGTPIYETDDNGNIKRDNNTEINRLSDVIAEQTKNKLFNENNLVIEQAKVDDANNLVRQAQTLYVEGERSSRDLANLQRYTNSPEFAKKMLDLESIKQEASRRQQQNDIDKQSLECQKRIINLQAQYRVRDTFDPNSLTPDSVQTQLIEFTSQAGHHIENLLGNQQSKINYEKRRIDLQDAMEKIMDRYVEADKHTAKANLMELIARKTERKLPDDIDEYDYDNMGKTIEFINMMNKLHKDILTKEEIFNGFCEHDDFKDFKWDVIDTVL